jgi:hypothetical protein
MNNASQNIQGCFGESIGTNIINGIIEVRKAIPVIR